MGKNPLKHWVFVKGGIAGRAYKAASLPVKARHHKGRLTFTAHRERHGLKVRAVPVHFLPFPRHHPDSRIPPPSSDLCSGGPRLKGSAAGEEEGAGLLRPSLEDCVRWCVRSESQTQGFGSAYSDA